MGNLEKVLIVVILVCMGALLEREVLIAEIAAFPLIAVAGWVTMLESRWFKIFPLLVILFAVFVASGTVHLSPLPVG